MTRFALALAATAALASPCAAKPNVVLIMADDLGTGDVGWHGGPYRTPHLDRLAKDAVRLERHYSLPVCSPTRSSLLTGRFNSRFGVVNPQNERALPWDTVTLAAALRSVGYRTGLVGKWHLGSRPEWGPQRFGFDFSYGSLAGGVTSWTHVYKTGPFARTWHRNGELVGEEGHVTDLITREAVRYIAENKDRPFFLYVPYTAVHLPIDEPAEWQNLDPGADAAARLYGGCVSHMDDGVGKILAALDRAGVRGNTLVVFLSDNGGSTDTQNNDPLYAGTHPSFRIPARNLGLRGKKGTVYEGGIRTPALAAWPGRLTGRDEHAPVHVADWMPTIAGLAGYAPPRDLKWDGRDVWPVISGAARPQPRTLYWVGPGRNSSAVRVGDLVLIRQRNKPDELYDLAADPTQARDLAATLPDDLRRLVAAHADVSARDDDALATPK